MRLSVTADTIVRSRIDADTKRRAASALTAMGLTISDAIRLLLLRVADEKRLPFDVKVPNAESRRAMTELRAGKGKRSDTAAALFEDLGI
jgi:DNA-damage-inducible protein J